MLSPSEVYERLESSAEGLTTAETEARRRTYGDNRLPKPPKPHVARRVLSQLTSPLILILLGVAAIAPILGHPNDSVIILIVITFNTVIGLVQEGRAARTLEALEKVFVATCTVRRDGRLLPIPSSEVVVGDLVIIKEGDRIPADGRLVEDSGLRIDESMLTGESSPVTKTSRSLADLPHAAALGDIRNAGFGQTLVVAGSGALIVTAVGRETEVGKIAQALTERQTEPPLAAKVRHLGRAITLVVAVLAAILFVIGILEGRPALNLLAIVLSLAVAVIPEGLPIVLTLVLARGVMRMASRNAVVKKLNAVEGLGQVQVICTDKTGTLTSNELVVQRAMVGDATYRVKGAGFGPDGTVYHGTRECRLGCDPRLDALARAAALFGYGSLREDKDRGWHPVGDPVDAAMRSFALRYGMEDGAWTVVEEQPFSYALKRRAGRWERDGERVSCLAGSPESVLAICEMEAPERQRATETLTAFAADGLRVIAVAERDGDLPLDVNVPWRFVGFLGMGDNLRPHVVESIAWCREQGIRVVMVTGDHPGTALAIAKKAGIAEDEDEVLNGPDLEAMDDEALAKVFERIRVFSRIAPTHKLRIIKAFRARGYLTAMTGDGVNDAPALHQADIGVAMGKSGTDVAREAAHLVLLDDNFATIVAAIQEGRSTVSNVRRVIMYLFSTSAAEAGLITLALLLNMPLPLLPGQIIWINLVTDSFLDVSLAMEPRHGSKHATGGALIDRRSLVRMALLGSTMTIGTFILFTNSLHSASDAYRYTITLTTLAAFQWLNAWNARSETISLARLSPFSNPYLIAATAVVVGLHLLAMHTQPLQGLLGLTPLSGADWAILLAVVSTVILVDELWKKVPHRPRGQEAVLR